NSMLRLRDNIFYSLAILNFFLALGSFVYILIQCGLRPGLIFISIIFLVFFLGSFFAYSRKTLENLIPGVITFRSYRSFRRTEVSEGDVLVLRYVGPWLLLVFQLIICVGLCTTIYNHTFGPRSKNFS